jgi:glycosyltransferase involved in cell wall biosynthesis
VQIHQFHGVVAYGDAIGNQILNLQRMLRKIGHKSEIFAEFTQGNFESTVHSCTKYRKFSSPNNVLLCHFSIRYSEKTLYWLKSLPDRKVLIYHNITPHHYFAGVNETFCQETRLGREQLAYLHTLTQVGWGASDFNRQELALLGWQQTEVLPIVFEPAMYQDEPDAAVLQRWTSTAGPKILFVGRLVPNKRFEDIVLTFYHLKKFIEPQAHLLLVGSTDQMEPYLAYLQALVKQLGLSDVTFVGHVSRKELVAYYRVADVYLSMSEHEGFGAPLLESMYFDLPVVAYEAAAVAETMGNAGILITRKDHAAVAELINLIARDGALRTRILERQRERWQAFTPNALMPHLQRCLEMIR